MKILAAWAIAVGLPAYGAWLLYPPRPGADNDLPFLVGILLIAYWSAVTAWVAGTLMVRRA
jgi:hypothetical protein